jgi:hypothetical protein
MIIYTVKMSSIYIKFYAKIYLKKKKKHAVYKVITAVQILVVDKRKRSYTILIYLEA